MMLRNFYERGERERDYGEGIKKRGWLMGGYS